METVDLNEGPEVALFFLAWYFVILELIINIYFWYHTVHCHHFYKSTNKMPSAISPPALPMPRMPWGSQFLKLLHQGVASGLLQNSLSELPWVSFLFVWIFNFFFNLRIKPKTLCLRGALPLSYTLALLFIYYSVPLTSFVGLWLCFGTMHPLVVFQEMMHGS